MDLGLVVVQNDTAFELIVLLSLYHLDLLRDFRQDFNCCINPLLDIQFFGLFDFS